MKKQKEEKKKKSLTREILEWILTIVVAIAIALPIRAFGFELVRVDGESMDNTLANGEIMFVTKYDYASTWLSFPWQDDESKEKAKIGQQWDMLAGSNYRYFMVFESKSPDYPGAYSYDRFMEILKGL